MTTVDEAQTCYSCGEHWTKHVSKLGRGLDLARCPTGGGFWSHRNTDTSYSPEPVCPWCGHTYPDAWELSLGDDDDAGVECGRCERSFRVTCSVSVDYSTEFARDDPP